MNDAPKPPADTSWVTTGAPAADHAHLCNHTPDASGDTQGCPRWPSCLDPDPPFYVPRGQHLTAAQMADFERRFIESLRGQLHAPGLLVTPYRAPRGPLQRLRRWWRG